jgi:hypothetical protein
MKTISKKKLDELIAMTKQYWDTGERDILQKRIDLASTMEKETGLTWGAILDLLDGILANSGFAPNAENEDIYCVLRVLGWKVTDDGTEHPAN